MDLSIIVPTYNEAVNIPIVVWILYKQLKSCKVDYEIIVVDDNSPDGTAAVVGKLAACWPQLPIVLLSRPCKLGLGSAYVKGLEKARGKFVILLDADLSHHPKYIPSFLEKQRQTGCDIVTGTRYQLGGGVSGWGLLRKTVSRGANIVASTLLGASTSDLTGAFRLYRRSVLQQLLSCTTSTGYAFQMEVIIRAQYAGCSIQEVPIVFVDRLFGDSKLGVSEVWLFLKGLLHLFMTL